MDIIISLEIFYYTILIFKNINGFLPLKRANVKSIKIVTRAKKKGNILMANICFTPFDVYSLLKNSPKSFMF